MVRSVVFAWALAASTGARLRPRRALALRGGGGGAVEAQQARLLADGARLWNGEDWRGAITAYDAALALGAVTGGELLQAHANLGAAHMQLAHGGDWSPATLDAETFHVRAAARHWAIPHAAAPCATSEFFLALLRKDLALLEATAAAHGGARGAAALEVELEIEAVPRVAAADLSLARFRAEFAETRRPVVLTGLALPDAEALLASLEPYGDASVPLRRRVSGSHAWAELGGAVERAPLRDVLAGGRGDDLVLFDCPLPHTLEFPIPRYFSGDLLNPDGSDWELSVKPGVADEALRGQWPSLFAQPAGTRCGLHVDAHATHFWQALLKGKKRWRIFPEAETHRLYPHGPNRAHFSVGDALSPDLDAFPALRGAKCWDATLEAGDVLFVPCGCAHQVANDAATLAVSANYVDDTNLDAAIDALFLTCEGGGGARPAFDALRRRLLDARDGGGADYS